MSLLFTNECFICKNAISKKDCNRIKNLGRGKSKNLAVNYNAPSIDEWIESGVHSNSPLTKEERLTGQKPDYEKNIKARISENYFTTEQWLYDLIWPYMLEANERSGWNLDISGAEAIQISRYKKGGFYKWHRDGVSDSLSAYDQPNNPLMHGNVRKMSVSLMLNNDYEGGGFEFCGYNQGECVITPIELKRGDMIFFTSGMEHRVTPVTKGVRYSLVSWFVGPPIR